MPKSNITKSLSADELAAERMCGTCPFNFTEESAQAQNYGCLPTPQEIREMERSTGRPWGCHFNEAHRCGGATGEGKPLSYRAWYYGVEAAD